MTEIITTSDYFTWQTLATLAGASAATALLTQFLKSIITIKTQILSYIIALVILLAATLFMGGAEPGEYVLAVFNAVVVAGTASNGAAFVQRLGKE